MIRLLEKNDYEKYIQLMKQFRPINNISYLEFNNIYDKIFNQGEIWIKVIDNNIIGSITILFEHKFINNLGIVGHIEDIVVNDVYKKKGYGSALIKKAIMRSKENKCYKISLVCNNQNTEFYLKNNFEKRGFHMSYLIKDIK